MLVLAAVNMVCLICKGRAFFLVPKLTVLLIGAMLFLCGRISAAQQQLPTVSLFAGEHEIIAEVAADDEQRRIGLQGRKVLAEGSGMLFDFHEDSSACMWMENTSLHLDAAFIAADGEIVAIARMFPYMRDTHCSPLPVRYVLELPAGWMKERGIAVGDRITGMAGEQ